MGEFVAPFSHSSVHPRIMPISLLPENVAEYSIVQDVVTVGGYSCPGDVDKDEAMIIRPSSNEKYPLLSYAHAWT